MRNDAASSTVHPKTFPPSMRGDTSSSDRPSLRVLVSGTLLLSLFFVRPRIPRRDPRAFANFAECDGTFNTVVSGRSGVVDRDNVLVFDHPHLEFNRSVFHFATDLRFAEFPSVDASQV